MRLVMTTLLILTFIGGCVFKTLVPMPSIDDKVRAGYAWVAEKVRNL